MYDKRIATFVEVAENRSFSKAAENLFITPTAVIKQMNQLESHIGVQLFIRTSRGVQLTEAGRNFLRESKKVIRFSDEAISRTKRIAESVSYTIRIGNSALFPYRPLMDVWYKGNNSYSQFKFTIVTFEDNAGMMIEYLSNLGQDIDIIVGPCSSHLWSQQCNFYQLGSWPLTVEVPRSHRLAGKNQLEVNDLRGERIMLVRRGDSPATDAVRDRLEEQGNSIHIVDGPVFYSVETFNYCEQNDILILSIDRWEEVHPSFISMPVDWDYRFPYGIMYSRTPSLNVIRFLEALREIQEGINPSNSNAMNNRQA